MFITGVLITLWVTSLSMLLIVGLERRAFRIRGNSLAAWQRWLIPLPLILPVGWNLDGVLNLRAWLETRPYGSHIRYPENHAGDHEFLGDMGLMGIGLAPFAMSPKPRQLVHLAPLFWIGYSLWLMLAFGVLAFTTGAYMGN